MNEEWRPTNCPIARDQPHGYKHYHTEACHASPEQIEADRPEVERLTQRLFRRLRASGGNK